MLGAALVLLAAPFYVGSEYALRIATLVCLYGTMALGWNLIGGYANQVSLGHGAFFGFGAYAAAILQVDYGISPWLGIMVGAAVAGLVAVLVGLPTFLLSGHYFALATLALLQVAHILFTYFGGITGGPGGISLPLLGNNPAMFQFELPIWYFYVGAAMLLLTLWVSRTVLRSKLGYELRAVKENPEAAQLAGVNLFRAKLTALVISAAIVAVAGVFYLQFVQFINPESTFSFNVSINMALFAIIGGVSTWWGPALGALLMVPLGEYTSSQLTGQLAPLGQFIYGLLLIVIIIWRPRGFGGLITTAWDRLMERTGRNS
jgi:branched-chain amino acid transport system permease protein